LALAMIALPSHALFKVVAPDGTVTYTDRPPPASVGRAVPPGKDAPAADTSAAALASLPLELRQTAIRFPVTLYSSTDCSPCDSGRRLLQTRGVPFVERRVLTGEDAEALDRLTGGRSVPTLTIGGQALRGYSDSDWTSYLDAAGYPRESQLPRSYQQPAATPLVERQPEAAPVARPAPAAEPIAAPPTTAPSPTGIRF
ncbi:MAG TPA: glutaredoxin family protein, partial [Burkholderiaceae bacterium]